MELPDNPTLQFLILNGYWFAVPIMIIEGPVATLVMAFFASFGYFNPFVVLFFGFFADLISDSAFYAIGYYRGNWFIKKFGKYFKLSPKSFDAVQQFFARHGGKSIFLAKIASGVVPPIFIVAGFSRMNTKKFYAYASLGGILWSSGLVALGYYFGSHLEGDFANLTSLLTGTGLALFIILAFFVFYRVYLHKVVERHWHLVFPKNNSAKNNGDTDGV